MVEAALRVLGRGYGIAAALMKVSSASDSVEAELTTNHLDALQYAQDVG